MLSIFLECMCGYEKTKWIQDMCAREYVCHLWRDAKKLLVLFERLRCLKTLIGYSTRDNFQHGARITMRRRRRRGRVPSKAVSYTASSVSSS